MAKIFADGAFVANDYISKNYGLDPRQAFLNEMRSYGLKPPAFPRPETIERFQDEDDKANQKSAWCWFTTFTSSQGIILVGRFGSWRNLEKVEFCSMDLGRLDRDELRKVNEQMEAARAAQEAERDKVRQEAARKAKELWETSKEPANHPYLVKKGVKPHGIRANGGNLIIPVSINGEITSVQKIGPNGEKKFHVGGAIKGGCYTIPGSETVVICEGFATGASIFEATGFTVLVAFNAGNLYDVAMQHKDAQRLIIAADDDRFGEINTGIEKAKKAAEATGAEVICPIFPLESKGTDFNDMAQEGVDIVSLFSARAPAPVVQEREIVIPKTVSAIPHGAISDIYSYYMATSGHDQPGFALNTSLAIVSVICGRVFRTDEENHTALFFMNIGRTSTGKEHAKTVVERVLQSCGFNYVTGDGFTSSGAVTSALLLKPKFISIIDELGMYLQAGMQKNANQIEANSAIMQCFGRAAGVFRPKNYSTMTLGKKQRDEVENREVFNPSMTLIGMSTPSTLFEALSHKDILSGLINRFIIHVSDLPISVRKRATTLEVPHTIRAWADKIRARIKAAGNQVELASQAPDFITIPFSNAALLIRDTFAEEVVIKMQELEKLELEGIGGRIVEIAQRLSLICALSRDPNAQIVADIDMQWAVEFMRQKFKECEEMVRKYMRSSDLDSDMMQIVQTIDKFPLGVDKGDLIKMGGVFRKYTLRQLDQVMASLLEAGYVTERKLASGGRPKSKYFPVTQADRKP